MVYKIAEQIKTSLDTITDWSADWETSFFGVVFNRADKSVFDTVIGKYADAGAWLDVARVKRRAELCDYVSTTIDDAVKNMLTNVEMFATANIPKNYPEDSEYPFYSTYYVMLNGYRWARELNHETTKWNAKAAYDRLLDFRLSQPNRLPFYKCNFDTNKAERLFGGTFSEDAALSGCFAKLADEIGPEATIALSREWYGFNRFWDGTHYTFSVGKKNWEKSAAAVLQRITSLHCSTLMWNKQRIQIDIINRFLANGWDSPQWGGVGVTIRHYPYDYEQVLDATLDTWALLHMYYKHLPEGMRTMLRNMLTGDVKRASDNLLQSNLFDSATNRFRVSSFFPTSDKATCWGCATLLLTAITPLTGCLAIPISTEGTEAYEHNFFNSHHFGFNYEARQIKLPIYAGKLYFTLGDKPVEAKFPYDGIYTITFTEDWNGVTSIVRVWDLDQIYLEPPKMPTAMEATVATLIALIGTAPLYAMSRTLIRKVKGA